MKYKDWLREWLELYEKPSVKPRTYAQYCDVIERRLIPALGDYDMDELETITEIYRGSLAKRKYENG